ncbi:cytochrome C oxidase subunit IV family protein [Mechercharimyces sp. CAU 1602]|uniref:cytochrome C oxidase subunit IV family protein n=1 Tax=Mechercharimyces sp. CAU 1602 TaxID=2973933 RepID=UPI002162595C|nr:cytochrome C oxidase subunit IV family protein [Mechercharimyces sp. CAU 1602]MCS1350102.1 cytochrome C oxidase subunit IV family protein [Mechercharimyces sp. CAU 1602]
MEIEPKHEPTLTPTSPQPGDDHARKHIISFISMLILTGISFYLVATNLLPPQTVIVVILILAGIQVLLQFFTFMHLDQKGHFFPLLFLFTGIIVAATVILATTIFMG